MSEQSRKGHEPDFPLRVDLDRNARRLAEQFTVEPQQQHMDWAAAMPLVHGCSMEMAIAILREGHLQSHMMSRGQNEQATAYMTGDLDRRLGQDRYTFFTLGKTFPLEPFDVYFMIDPFRALQDDTFVAMKDLAALGGLVSDEMIRLMRQQNPRANTAKINERAAATFFSSLVRGSDFIGIFARFLATHYPDIGENAGTGLGYWRDTRYPNEPPRTERLGNVRIPNVWEGPQVQISRPVMLEHVQAVILRNPHQTTIPGISAYPGLPIGHAAVEAERHNYAGGTYSVPDNPVKERLNRSFYVNLIAYNIAEQNKLYDAQ